MDLPVRIRVEDVGPTDGETDAAPQLVGQVEIEERLRPEPLVVGGAVRMAIVDGAVIGRPREAGEPSAGPARREPALLVRQRVLEAVAVLGGVQARSTCGSLTLS